MKYINQDIYTNVYKPNKNAMIVGSFNNVEEHKANFESFAERSGEIVNNLSGGKIDRVGFDFLPPLKQAGAMKASAMIVEHWFINGFTIADINNSINVGSLSTSQVKTVDGKFVNIVPSPVIALLKDADLWVGTVFGLNVDRELQSYGLSPQDILTYADAYALFQLKGKYDDNFHKDIDLLPELTGQEDMFRYIKIAETTRAKVSFEVQGGSDNFLYKGLVFFDRENPGKNRVYVYTTETLIDADLPQIYYEVAEDGLTSSIYIMVKDDISETDLLLQSIFADFAGDYGLMGSRTIEDGLSLIPSLSVFQQANIDDLRADILAIEPRLTQIDQDIEIIKTITPRVDSLEAQKQLDRADIETLKNDKLDKTTFNSAIQQKADKLTTYTRIDIDGKFNPLSLKVDALETSVGDTTKGLVKDMVDTKTKDQEQDGKLATIEPQVASHERRVASLEATISGVNATSEIIETEREWDGSLQPTTTTTNSNTYTITGTTIGGTATNDGVAFVFSANKKLLVSFSGKVILAGTTQVDVAWVGTLIVGRTKPIILQAVRETTSGDINALYATLSSNGVITLTRNSGSSVQMGTIVVDKLSQFIVARSAEFVKKVDFQPVEVKATSAITRLDAYDTWKTGIEEVKTYIGKTTLTTTSQTVGGAINEINSKINLDDTTLVALETALGL